LELFVITYIIMQMLKNYGTLSFRPFFQNLISCKTRTTIPNYAKLYVLYVDFLPVFFTRKKMRLSWKIMITNLQKFQIQTYMYI
jgi:hypothetical protein